MRGRSACDHCGAAIAAYDLVPVISYIALRGKCRRCGKAICPDTIIIELAGALIGALSLLFLPVPQALAAAIFGWLLLPLAVLDYRHLWLPNALVLALAATGLLAAPVLMPQIGWTDRAIGGLAGFLGLEAVRLAYRKLRHRDGMGPGDAKLFAALGFWLGWQMLPITLLVASAIGVMHALAARFVDLRHDIALPLGSYLAASALLSAWAATLAT